jgi:hypothetical protein
METILGFAKQIEELILERNIVLGDSAELFLQIDDDDPQSCGYYLVDHTSRTIFWLEDVSMEDLGIPPVISASHTSTCHFYFGACKTIYIRCRIRP